MGVAHYFSEHFIIPKLGTRSILPEFDEIDPILTSNQLLVEFEGEPADIISREKACQ